MSVKETGMRVRASRARHAASARVSCGCLSLRASWDQARAASRFLGIWRAPGGGPSRCFSRQASVGISRRTFAALISSGELLFWDVLVRRSLEVRLRDMRLRHAQACCELPRVSGCFRRCRGHARGPLAAQAHPSDYDCGWATWAALRGALGIGGLGLARLLMAWHGLAHRTDAHEAPRCPDNDAGGAALSFQSTTVERQGHSTRMHAMWQCRPRGL